jgi:hypothetical protein
VYDPSRITLDQDMWPLHATPRDVVAALPNLSFSLRVASQSRITQQQIQFQMYTKVSCRRGCTPPVLCTLF